MDWKRIFIAITNVAILLTSSFWIMPFLVVSICSDVGFKSFITGKWSLSDDDRRDLYL